MSEAKMSYFQEKETCKATLYPFSYIFEIFKLSFPMVLGIWTPGPMFVQHMLYPLSHPLLSKGRIFQKSTSPINYDS